MHPAVQMGQARTDATVCKAYSIYEYCCCTHCTRSAAAAPLHARCRRCVACAHTHVPQRVYVSNTTAIPHYYPPLPLRTPSEVPMLTM